MATQPTSHNFLSDGRGLAEQAEGITAWAAPDMADADLYRILVAQALREGRFRHKGEFDAQVRALGTVEQAEAVIAFGLLRPDCDAWRRGDLMVCDCGAFWKVDASDPPYCKKPYK